MTTLHNVKVEDELKNWRQVTGNLAENTPDGANDPNMGKFGSAMPVPPSALSADDQMSFAFDDGF